MDLLFAGIGGGTEGAFIPRQKRVRKRRGRRGSDEWDVRRHFEG
jgi:hypothetical protein